MSGPETDFHVLSSVAPIANAAVLSLLPAMVGAGLLVARRRRCRSSAGLSPRR
jgi:hypothetical protein